MSDDDENIICYICEKVEADPIRVIECSQCSKCVHFRCKKIYGNAVRKARNKKFLCSPECAEIHTRNLQQTAGYDEVITELRLLRQSVYETQKESAHVRIAFEKAGLQIATLVETSRHIEASQDFLSQRFDDLQSDLNVFKNELGCMKAENENIKKEVAMWKVKHNVLSETVDRLETDLEKLNRISLSKNAVIVGLPSAENENVRDLIHKLGEAVGYTLGTDDIVDAKRCYVQREAKNLPPILVSFSSETIKEELLERKRLHGVLLASAMSNSFAGSTRKVTVRDEMTSYGRELLRETKEVQAKLGFKYVWPGRNGKILLRRYDGAKVEQINSRQQLGELQPTVFKHTEGKSVSMMLN